MFVIIYSTILHFVALLKQEMLKSKQINVNTKLVQRYFMSSQNKHITIIIPTYNEEGSIEGTLNNL